jgi:HPt (histidine-containing phosphotransfer) domain-containing protein
MPAHLPVMNPTPPQPLPAVELPPPVDLDRLADLAGGEDGLAELVELYLTQTASQIASIRTAITEGQVAEVRRIAHSAAGANATCGMQGVVASLRALERMGESGDIAEAPAHIEAVSQEFDRIKAYLEQHTKR